MADHVDTVIVRQDGVLSGRATFRGTRIQAEILFENLAEGYSIDEIVESFPTLDREDVRAAILQAGRLIIAAAPEMPAPGQPDKRDTRTMRRARLP